MSSRGGEGMMGGSGRGEERRVRAEEGLRANENFFIVRMFLKLPLSRPSRLQIPGGPKMARFALRRWAIDGQFALM